MIKIFLIFVLAVTVYGQQAKQCRQICRTDAHLREVCAADNRGISCHRMSQCQLNRDNCHRRLNKRPLLLQVSMNRCRRLKSPNSSGSCARPIRKPRAARPECRNLRCVDTSPQTSCYRSKRNNCKLLTNCQQQRLNCERGHLNRVEWTDPRQCAGMKAGQVQRKCKSIPRRG